MIFVGKKIARFKRYNNKLTIPIILAIVSEVPADWGVNLRCKR